MDRKNKPSSFMREHETYTRAAKFVNHDRRFKVPLSREFQRKPYGLAIKEEQENGKSKN